MLLCAFNSNDDDKSVVQVDAPGGVVGRACCEDDTCSPWS
jgi:hypothetical protein